MREIKSLNGLTMFVKLPMEWVEIKKQEAKDKGYKWTAYARAALFELLEKEAKSIKNKKAK